MHYAAGSSTKRTCSNMKKTTKTICAIYLMRECWRASRNSQLARSGHTNSRDLLRYVCVFAVVHLESPGDRHLGLRIGPLSPSTCALHVHQLIHSLCLPQFSLFMSTLTTLSTFYYAGTAAWKIHLSHDKHRSSAAVAPAPSYNANTAKVLSPEVAFRGSGTA